MAEPGFDSILIRYGELCLKQNNRGLFEKQLKDNVSRQLKSFCINDIQRFEGGMRVKLTGGVHTDRILGRVTRVPGLSWCAPTWEVNRDTEEIADCILAGHNYVEDTPETFGIETQRSDKSFNKTSMEVSDEVGAIVQNETGLAVDLDDPDWTIHIHILSDRAHVFFEKNRGLNGLPVGSSGDVLALLSGGIDSPVATIEALKRGCRVDLLHFYSYPSPDRALSKKMRKLVEVISKYATTGTLYMAPYYPFDLESMSISSRMEMILFRRHVVRVAEKLAKKRKYEAFVSGESIGQVASQTIENIASIADAANRPIIRPLISLNKQDIIDKARAYGTYEISIGDYQDCCAISANHPHTQTDTQKLRTIEQSEDIYDTDNRVFKKIVEYSYEPGIVHQDSEMSGQKIK